MNASFPDHFSRVAARYADYRPRYPASLYDYLATLVPADATVWDCAAGNGQATVDLAARFRRVIATDASPQQIASAQARPNVEYRVAPAEQCGLDDASVGLVTVAQALHWFDLPRFYAEVRRVLRPGGLLAVWSYGVTQVEGEDVNALVHEYYAGTLGAYWPASRQLVEASYRTLPFPFAELAPPPFRMEVQWTLEQLLGYFSTWSATNRCIEATGENPLAPLAAKLAPRWGPSTRTRQVTWPLGLRVGTSAVDRGGA